jgi:hypothetical protein
MKKSEVRLCLKLSNINVNGLAQIWCITHIHYHCYDASFIICAFLLPQYDYQEMGFLDQKVRPYKGRDLRSTSRCFIQCTIMVLQFSQFMCGEDFVEKCTKLPSILCRGLALFKSPQKS